MQAQITTRNRRAKELLALLVFLFIGGMLAMPCLCNNGAIAGRSKIPFLLLVFCRLAWQLYKRTFSFRDYFIYFALVVGFCLWLDSYV